jgi:CheY-specific phosphatase CheX
MRLTPVSVNVSASNLVEEVGDLFKANVVDVFEATFGLSVGVEESREVRERHGPHIAACVGFMGEVRGVVYLYMKESVARYLTSQLLSLDESGLGDRENMRDAIGELGNMIVGPIKARLCKWGYSCVLTVPWVVRGESVRVEPGRSAECLLMTIAYGDESILLELLIKSFKNPHKARVTD